MVKSKPVTDPRQLAIGVLQRVILHGESLSSLLPSSINHLSSTQDRAFCQMLIYGVLRQYWRLTAIVKQLLQKPLKDKDMDIQLAMLIALYQLLDTRVPDYAAVDAAVSMIRKSRKKWAAGMVNGVLRNFIRQQEALLTQLSSDPQAEFSHPQWMIDQLKNDWPEQWVAILQANNQQAPMVLRINQQQISIDDYLAALEVAAHRHDVAGSGIVLEQAQDVNLLPGYDAGWFSVQDAGAQQAAPLLDLHPGQRVLDCCAAPGGKTSHMLEIEPSLQVLAMDVSEQRLERVGDNLARLGFSVALAVGDAASPDDWWDGQPFDRILLDVPCSASGVIRRHPDIKMLRRETDLAELVEMQQAILQNIWPLLAVGGKMLYATCSVFKAENDVQVQAFINQQADAGVIDIDAGWGSRQACGRQILPGESAMDGFYYALLTKYPS
ncbi:MAG: 16S rRNA (cytosine(967)-C(5))-methyltransferase RsmB [Gammaproteobacteria bacterium]|nr:16S rRNA (cytosine(967)-C(5))-methyltransferase RsmB [Gammaproteobacteria bacterium]